MLIKGVFIVSVVMAGLVTSAMADERIECPLDRVEFGIVTPIPEGWSTSVKSERLRDTRIDRSEERKYLICQYGPAGSVRIEHPQNMECRTNRSGFVCRGNRGSDRNPPQTYRTGLLDVPQTFNVDLDEGRVGNSGADFWYQAETRVKKFITPRNGAEISVSGVRNRGYQGCAAADYSDRPVSLSDIPVGTYVCVRTSEGRISEFRMNAIIPAGETTRLKIGYTTWRGER